MPRKRNKYHFLIKLERTYSLLSFKKIPISPAQDCIKILEKTSY